MYSVLPSFILGFHGCDASVAENVFCGKSELRFANNDYDWLGHGVYFWENNPARALQFAKQAVKYPQISRGKIKKPAVVGAVIDLGHCLNLLDSKYIELIKATYIAFEQEAKSTGQAMPENTVLDKAGDVLVRKLDCAIIEMAHREQNKLAELYKDAYKFDSTRGVFTEGSQLYPNSGFRDKNHIQICVRNPVCIKGYFRVKG